MDETIVTARGGFRTRAELMREAVENLLNEIDFPEAPAEGEAVADETSGGHANQQMPVVDEFLQRVPAWERDELTLSDLVGTALVAPARAPWLIENGAARVIDEPLLGLHNRDYASLWAAQRLSRYTPDGAMSLDEFLERVTTAAWYFGAQLQRLMDRDHHRRLAVLFPTNTAKRPSAERGFQSFAIGSLTHRRTGLEPVASGPLYSWRAIQVDAEGRVGLTPAGWELLRLLDGLSLDLPHDPALASRFLKYLGDHAPSDRWGFDHLLTALTDGPDRQALVATFAQSHREWTASTASSVAQGYVARAREWGLVEPKLVEGRYWLTEFGRQHLEESAQAQ